MAPFACFDVLSACICQRSVDGFLARVTSGMYCYISYWFGACRYQIRHIYNVFAVCEVKGRRQYPLAGLTTMLVLGDYSL